MIGVLGARRVPMTAMPQMVAIFNGAGGGAAAVVAISEFLFAVNGRPASDRSPAGAHDRHPGGRGDRLVSLTGSIVAFGKLQGHIPARPVSLSRRRTSWPHRAGRAAGDGHPARGADQQRRALHGLVAVALVAGVLIVMPIGGADMPVVISLLNSYTGIAVGGDGLRASATTRC